MKRFFLYIASIFLLISIPTNIFAQQRIVSLAPAATEILFALGAGKNIVARTALCDYPEEASNIHVLGGFDGKSYSIEAIIALRPDFVYAYSGMHDHLVEPLQKYGINVFISDVTSIQDVIDEIRSVGALINCRETATQITDTMQEKLKALEASTALSEKKTLYWEVWNNPYMSASKNTFIGNIITLIGGTNIFADSVQSYPIVSDESILAKNPEIILYANDSPISAKDIAHRTGWYLLKAVQDNAIYEIDANSLTRPGPRILDAVEELATIID